MFFLYFLVFNCVIYNCYPLRTNDTNEYNIKLLVVIDPEVRGIKLLPGNNHMSHILTKLMEASEVFKLPGLDHNIKISLYNVFMYHVDIDNRKDHTVLDIFEETINRALPPTEKYDYAIYFTTNMRYGYSYFSPILCNKETRAGVINFEYKALRDNLQFIIAHQLMNAMGIDDLIEPRKCNDEEMDDFMEYVMKYYDDDFENSPGQKRWSTCSKRQLEAHLRAEQIHKFTMDLINRLPDTQCLRNKPHRDLLAIRKLQTYIKMIPRKQICEHITDSRYTFINEKTHNLGNCRALICTNPTTNEILTRNQLYNSELNGVECGTSAMCMDNECVQMSKLTPINGGWTDWQPVSNCSQKCGGGERSMERYCTNPNPMYGGEYCSGENTKNEMCNMEPCHSSDGIVQASANRRSPTVRQSKLNDVLYFPNDFF